MATMTSSVGRRHDGRRAPPRAAGVRRAGVRRVGIARLVAAVTMAALPKPRHNDAYIHHDVPQAQTDAAEACYQCVVLVRGDREAGWKLLVLRSEEMPWVECLAILRADRATLPRTLRTSALAA